MDVVTRIRASADFSHPKTTTMFHTLFLTLLSALHAPNEVPTIETTAESFAVVELFTSQGCSSCPPADAVLSKLVDNYAASKTPVYALSFHVDYWNYLGWRDPFSDERFSQRQRAYARQLQSRVYTPQMVVNGQTEFVGSREREAGQHVKQALSERRARTVSATAEREENEIIVTFSTDAIDGIVNVALVERGIETAVGRGENRNRTLRHDNVVRAFDLARPDRAGEGSVTLELPESSKYPVNHSQTEVIVYVQDADLGRVRAATRTTYH